VAPVAPISIDFDGIETRIVDLPIPAAELSDLQTGEAGQIFFLRESDGKKAIQRFDLKDRKAETLLAEADSSRSPPTARSCCTATRKRGRWAAPPPRR
jgi:tricorn protease